MNSWLPILIFGSIIIVMICLVQIAMVSKGRGISQGFMTLTALIAVAILGILFLTLGLPETAVAGGLTLLGAIGGYLAANLPGSRQGGVKGAPGTAAKSAADGG